MNPQLIVLAGPNGAGKSTFFQSFLANLRLPFLNADILARETGLDPYEAAEEIAVQRDVLIERQFSFVTETVLSDPVGEKVALFAAAAASGFDVHLIYIGITDAEMSAKRVEARVGAGGHDVPLEKILARYERTLANLERAIKELPRVTLYDNSSFDAPFRFVTEFRAGTLYRQAENEVPGWAQRSMPRL